MMKLRKPLATILLSIGLACSLFLLLALDDGLSPSVSAKSMSFIRLIHASPDIGTVDIFVDGQKLLSNFQFASVSKYVALPAGTHEVQIALIGQGPNAATITQTLSVQEGAAYTVAALGTKQTKFALDIVKDDNRVIGDKAKVRIYHLSPGAGKAQVTTRSDLIVDALPYLGVSNYVLFTAGTYTFNVKLAPADVTVPISITLQPWTVTSIFAVGKLDGTPRFQMISSQEKGIPGMPQTGSDPNAPLSSAAEPASLLWPWVLIALVLLGAFTSSISVACRRTPTAPTTKMVSDASPIERETVH
ncbi:DUF4397 domain-containing protein [Ktedonosporobacter rubrisoli]|nr:DUF4397 domain-containing protein [Ktedonosporobacter rubrisoli]